MLRSSASRLCASFSTRTALSALKTARLQGPRSCVQVYRNTAFTNPRLFSASACRLTALSRTCPSCSSPLPTPLPACPHCSFISRLPSSATHYDIFDLSKNEHAFDIDLKLLKTRFRDLQRIVHPDKWSGKSQAAQATAAELSSVVNKAYGTLTNPYTRAEYLLQLQGMTIGESDNLEDPTLIMEVMEVREELEGAESHEEVERIRQENLSKIEQLLPVLVAAVTLKDWTSVKEYAVRLKYLQGIDLAAEAWPNQPFDH